MSPGDRALLDRIQAGVPLVPRPFARIAADLGDTEDGLLHRLQRLAGSGVLRQIGGIFDPRACGYAVTLVAARVPAGRLEAAAEVIGAHPGVTHSYERDHPWNLWFTLAVSPHSTLGLDATVEHLARAAGATAARLLPAVAAYKIAARFDLSGEAAAPVGAPRAPDAGAEQLDRTDVAAIRALQEPLALEARPFAAAARAGLDEETLLARARDLLARGVMRRFAALLDHRRAGFRANVMAVWAVPPERLAEAGTAAARLAAVSHCYARQIYPDWPYALFTMIHGRTRQECETVIETLRATIQPADFATLWTVREFKKTRLRLFTAAEAAWEAHAVAAGAPA